MSDPARQVWFTPLNTLSHPREMVRQFTPNWFATTMGTGILAIALAQFPGIPVLTAIGHGLWIFNIALFSLCTLLYVARWLLYFHEARRIFSHSIMSMFFGCIPMGLATIINGILIFGAPEHGDFSVTIAVGLWWFDVALALSCGIAIPFTMFTRQSHSIDQMTGLWLLPIVASEVAAVSGALLLPYLVDPTQQLTILIINLVLWSCSVPLAMGVLTILFLRMAVHKLPHINMAASSWLALGPIGTGALGLLIISQNAPAVLAANGLGIFAAAFSGASLLGAVLLWGYGLWWMAMAIAITISYIREGLPFNIGWWGYTFPLGVYAVATLRLATLVPLPAIGTFGTALVAALAILWLIIGARTVKGGWSGALFHAPCLNKDSQDISPRQL
ncbi:TDT family transporter [Pararhizobium sp.]|uniref:TDT family transporter n=1 Tax=Pararhizobium sp. TaxID=1977563 RepID=UPI003D109ED2